jgi:ribonuclease HI
MRTSDSSHLVYIHADESCLGVQFSGQPRPGGAAGIIERFDERRGWYRRDYFVSDPDTTNQRMAIRSALEGLRALKQPCRVVFHSDSNYLIQAMTTWIFDWARRGWRRKGGPIENLQLWARLVTVAARHQIQWRWVRGHAGDPKNEYVNSLAVQAARHQKTSRGLVESGFDTWLEAQQETGRFLDFYDLPPEIEFMPHPKPPEPPTLP